jgi:ribosomal protein L7/L12
MSDAVLLAVVWLFGAVSGWILRSRVVEPAGLVRHLPPSSPDELDARLRQLLGDGRKIDAIKLYREFHGVGLKEAKQAIDAMARRWPST